jgi:hypothetical protein
MLIDGTVGLTAGLGSWLSRRRRARQGLDAGSGTILVSSPASQHPPSARLSFGSLGRRLVLGVIIAMVLLGFAQRLSKGLAWA